VSGDYRELRVAKKVLRKLQAFSPDEQREVVRLLGVIRIEPTPDRRNKHTLMLPPLVFTVYTTNQFWIVYHVVGNRVTILNVAHADEGAPSPW
jgi:hypothetical protein